MKRSKPSTALRTHQANASPDTKTDRLSAVPVPMTGPMRRDDRSAFPHLQNDGKLDKMPENAYNASGNRHGNSREKAEKRKGKEAKKNRADQPTKGAIRHGFGGEGGI